MIRPKTRDHGVTSHPYKWVIFGVLAGQYLFGYFHRVCAAVVAPELIKAFDISGTALGVLASGYFTPMQPCRFRREYLQIPGERRRPL